MLINELTDWIKDSKLGPLATLLEDYVRLFNPLKIDERMVRLEATTFLLVTKDQEAKALNYTLTQALGVIILIFEEEGLVL